MDNATEPQNEKKPATEKPWDNALKMVQNVTQQATCYTRLVQKKIDLFSVNRKISTARNDLGRTIDDSRSAGSADFLEKTEVKAALQNLDNLKQNSAKLVEEIEQLQKGSQPEVAEPTDSSKQ